MGLDGLSIGNLGIHKESTSAQMANQAEQLANKGLEFKIKDVGEIVNKKGIQIKDDSSSRGEEFFEHNFNEDEEDNDDKNNNKNEKIDDKLFEKQDPKLFSVRLNQQTEMVELINNKERKVVETISATELMGLISKLDSASGILVNRKI